MANPEHVNILEQGVETWNKWREDNPDILPDLERVSLERANFERANFERANLKEASLGDANLIETNLKRANLIGVHLGGANIGGANLERANLERANLGGTNLERANLERANLLGANLGGAHLVEANLGRANLERANLGGANLERANLEKANLAKAHIEGANLTGANVKGTILEDKPKPEAEASPLASLKRNTSSEIETLRKEIEEKIDGLKNIKIGSDDLDSKMEEMISDRIDKEFDGNIVKKLGETVAKQAKDYKDSTSEDKKRESLKKHVLDQFNDNFTRLEAHANKAKEASTMFLVFGVIFALIGMAMAYFNINAFYHIVNSLHQENKLMDWKPKIFETIFHVPVSVPFIILSEVFALIMFRYYSKAIERFRSFTNEVTTLRLMYAGMAATIEYGTVSDISRAAYRLMNAERNRVLGKGANTIETLQSADETNAQSNFVNTQKNRSKWLYKLTT